MAIARVAIHDGLSGSAIPGERTCVPVVVSWDGKGGDQKVVPPGPVTAHMIERTMLRDDT